MIESYPLQWPLGRKRTSKYSLKADPFHMPSGRIRSELAYELRMMGADDFIISSNLMLRKDGLPYAGQKAPEDTGIALYFDRKGTQICISCDQYASLDANLRAIGKTVEAIRGIERWGTEEMMDAAFSGFKALPEPKGEDAWSVLGIPEGSAREEVRSAYLKLAQVHHPDKGGDPAYFSKINTAYQEVIKEDDGK